MNRLLCASIVIALLVVFMTVVAAEPQLEADDGEQVEEQDEQSTDIEEGRLRKHHLLYGGLRKTWLR